MNTCNRLDGELDEAEEEDESVKLCCSITRCGEGKPIVDFKLLAAPEDLEPNWELIQGNINEKGDELHLAI